jgi:hypothetical protein
MERINQRKALRTQFMNELFEMADGSDTNFVPTRKVAEKLGLDYEVGQDFDEVYAVISYLEGEHLIKAIGQLAFQVKLTHYGIREVEQAHSHPDEPTQHFAPINLVYAHNITNSPIQQGSPGATQSLTVIGQDHQQQLEDIVQQLRTSIDGMGLEVEDKAELEAEVRTLEAQVASPKPKKEIVHPSLQSARNILEGAASGVTAQGIIAGIGLLLSAL